MTDASSGLAVPVKLRVSERRLVMAEGSDHSVPEERPEVIVTAVQELLKLVNDRKTRHHVCRP